MPHAILWTQEDCPLCEKVKALLAAEGYEERAAAALVSGEAPDDEAMVQLAMQDMQLPLVKIDGAFVSPLDLLKQAA